MFGLNLTIKPLPHDIPGVAPPRRRAVIVDRSAPHVAPVLSCERAAARAVQHAPVVPDDHVAGAVPRHRGRVLLLRGVFIKAPDQVP